MSHECNSPVQLRVDQGSSGGSDAPNDDTGIPIVNQGCKLHERKDGPTAITRRAEVTFLISGLGEDNWTDYIDAFQEGGVIQPAEIQMAPIDDTGEKVGDPVPVFRGYIGQIGSTEGQNRARLTILDASKFLGQIEAGTTFTENSTIRDVLNYVRDRFTEEVDVFANVSIDATGVGDDAVQEYVELFGDERGARVPEGADLPSGRFSTNRDTLADVVRWVQDTGDVRVTFEPQPNNTGLVLRASRDRTATYDLTPDSTTAPYVIANNALYEMRPFNGLTLKGREGYDLAANSQDIDLEIATPIGKDSYPEATATYPPLVERFGSELTTVGQSKNVSEAGLKREAKKQLKERLDEVSGGAVVTTLAPQVRPFDRVIATPACSGVAADVEPLTYEVQRTVHRLVPEDDNLPQSELSVSISIDPEKIEASSTTKAVQTSKTGDNEPTRDDYARTSLAWGIQ